MKLVPVTKLDKRNRIAVVQLGATCRTSQPKLPITKRIHPPKNYLNFRKWIFLAVTSRILIFSQKEAFLMFSYFSRNGILRFSAQAQKIKEIHLEK